MVLVHDNDDDEVVDTSKDLGCENSRWGGNNCPQTWDNHNQYGMNMMFGDGHSEWVKKQPGTYLDFTDANRPPTPSLNASIDRVFLRSQYPWEYLPRR